MAFFGSHNSNAPGFSQADNPFAGLGSRDEDDDGLEFEETYDGLGDQLDETDDAFNDDTFGGGGAGPSTGRVGTDFDFFGQTAKVVNAIEEEQLRFHRQIPTAKVAPKAAPLPATTYYYSAATTSRPARSGYEKYKEEEPKLEVDTELWGVRPKKPPPAQNVQPSSISAPIGGRKIMSLEEVEASMLAQSKKPSQPVPTHHQVPPQNFQQLPSSHPPQASEYAFGRPEPSPGLGPTAPDLDVSAQAAQHHGHGHPVTILQRPQSKHSHSTSMPKVASPVRQQAQQPPHDSRQRAAPQIHPTQILQNPNRLSGDATKLGVPTHPSHPSHHRQQSSISQQQHIITHPAQVAQLSDAEKAAYLEQEAKRAKRNHKIFLLSRDNGIMTPQDKSFVTRIQLQQLVAATGNPNDHGTDESIGEDFYYQVYSQIRGSTRQHPGQPLTNFAQTYLYQTGSRQHGMRRQRGVPENHVQRMEQQVQRAVEAAKNKPKNKQLVIEGSLGKISFSNAKTPKPLLNIKRADGGGENQRPGSAPKSGSVGRVVDRKTVLRDIENVYATLMTMEDHERKMPPPPPNDSDIDAIQRHVEWQEESQRLNSKLWHELKVHEPIGATLVHPFIAFLSFSKGMKALPRVFRHTTHEQRTTILTMIVVHLEQLDVVRDAQINNPDAPLKAAMREKVELFQLTVVSSLFNFMHDVDLDITSGVLGLVSNLSVDTIARSKIGTSVLTMILSRAAIIKHSGEGNPQILQAW
jgi:DNA topoisomerase 2-associated protein PAT1